MSVTPRVLDSATPAARNAVARRERLFFGGMAIAMLATVIAGFGPTYYFSTVSGSTLASSAVRPARPARPRRVSSSLAGEERPMSSTL